MTIPQTWFALKIVKHASYGKITDACFLFFIHEVNGYNCYKNYVHG